MADLRDSSSARTTQVIDQRWHPLIDGGATPWASAWGEDEFGIWAAFTLADITQKLRWIPPGQFQMGSPKNEPGRYENEGPAHEVVLSAGYWLFNTPVTQTLWSEVMDDNPSNFQSPNRPVEQVSWHDAQTFLAKINAAVPELALTLPTEAQWEHACRAGTTSALYTGDIDILGDANAPALDPIAWYGGNSGVDFELINGLHRSWLKDMQYPEGKAGTHPVALKAANPWGLYDMLGNVWEWCADGQRAYRAALDIDPTASFDKSAAKVLRGGSWDGSARFLRASYRSALEPNIRDHDFGFRCARVQG